MRPLFFTLLLAVASSAALCAETNALCFFVVSQTPVPNGRYLDTTEFPKVGYISNAPSYVLTRLRQVLTNDVTYTSTIVGQPTETNTVHAVRIWISQADKTSFAVFTRQNIDRRVVLMLKGKPLVAPMIRAPIENGALQLPTFPKSVIDDIQKLIERE
ncbi:MAG: hypothetical protein ACLQU3_22880 [Limisphaerales bacterium]